MSTEGSVPLKWDRSPGGLHVEGTKVSRRMLKLWAWFYSCLTLALYKNWELASWVIQGPLQTAPIHQSLELKIALQFRGPSWVPHSQCQDETEKDLVRKRIGEDGGRELPFPGTQWVPGFPRRDDLFPWTTRPSVSPKELRAWAARCGEEDWNPGLWDSRILSSFWRLWAPGWCVLLCVPQTGCEVTTDLMVHLYFQGAPDLPGWCSPRWHGPPEVCHRSGFSDFLPLGSTVEELLC